MKALQTWVMVMGGLVAFQANAWDGIVSGAVAGFDVTSGQNYGFRVYLAGATSYCGATPPYDFAYINEADSNYKSYAAALMMAKVEGSLVTLHLMREGGACKIGYLAVR